MDDLVLRQDVLDALEFEPRIDAADIGAAVEDGVVTLTGHVRTYAEKITAQRIVEGVKGVRGIAEAIEVRPVGSHITADDEIAKRIVRMMEWNTFVPEEKVQVTVQKGWVTLKGDVEWQYERKAAEKVVRGLPGVRGVSNNIRVAPKVKAQDVQERIENALVRDAKIEAKAIKVGVSGSRVTLDGEVHNWAERQAVERAAWAAPGVTSVVDHISISG